MRDSTETFSAIEKRHQYLHAQLRKSKAYWARAVEDHKPEEQREYEWLNCVTSTEMLALRDIGRFMLGMDAEDDCNPFDGPDDY